MAATWVRVGPRSRRSVQALSEAAPVDLADGLSLLDVFSIKIGMHAPNGQTFTGAGSLLGYVLMDGLWVRDQRGDYPDLSDLTGLQDGSLPALSVTSPRDRFALIASGVGLSGGAQVTIDFWCTNRPAREVT